MSERDPGPLDVTDSAEAIAQSRTRGRESETRLDGEPGAFARQPGEGVAYDIDEALALSQATRPYERLAGDPLYRRLPVFSLNASTKRRNGRVAVLKLPYEPLEPGVRGRIMQVDSTIEGVEKGPRAELDNPHILLNGGYVPSISDPCFHQQMVYAVAMQTYAHFQIALGRDLSWRFDRRGEDGFNRLTLKPFGAPMMPQAWYDRAAGEIVFGYFEPSFSTPSVPNKEGSYVFLSLSHDVIVHEVTHAILDGLRPGFFIASHPDVSAFHEAFADLIAVFQHFTHEEVVISALGEARGNLADATTLHEIGAEFGRAISDERTALRTLQDERTEGEQPDPSRRRLTYSAAPDQAHERGRLLACAVFKAFRTIYERRSQRFIKLATGGTGVLRDGDMGGELTLFLVGEVKRLALQFMTICIRAIDYCPPVDVRFGDYLRALITADLDMVPDDDWGYREAIIHAFGERDIFGEGTPFMTEEALAWGPPRCEIEPIREVSLGETRFDGDPARPVDAAELRRQAAAIGRCVTDPAVAGEFGLVSPHSRGCDKVGCDRPVVKSVRSARRIGPDKQVTFDTIAEVVQRRRAVVDGVAFSIYGGSTLVIGPRGEVRYVVRKRVDHAQRAEEQAEFIQDRGRSYWANGPRGFEPRNDALERICGESDRLDTLRPVASTQKRRPT